MFGLLDIPAYFLWFIGNIFQGVAKCIASKAFIKWKTGTCLEISEENQVRQIAIIAHEISNLHYKATGTPLQVTLVNTTHGYCLYNGAICLTTGTLEECKKYLTALVWLLHHTILLKGKP